VTEDIGVEEEEGRELFEGLNAAAFVSVMLYVHNHFLVNI
jgi:hypothetical protein